MGSYMYQKTTLRSPSSFCDGIALYAGTHAKCNASAHFVGRLGSSVSDSKQASLKIEALIFRVREFRIIERKSDDVTAYAYTAL